MVTSKGNLLKGRDQANCSDTFKLLDNNDTRKSGGMDIKKRKGQGLEWETPEKQTNEIIEKLQAILEKLQAKFEII